MFERHPRTAAGRRPCRRGRGFDLDPADRDLDGRRDPRLEPPRRVLIENRSGSGCGRRVVVRRMGGRRNRIRGRILLGGGVSGKEGAAFSEAGAARRRLGCLRRALNPGYAGVLRGTFGCVRIPVDARRPRATAHGGRLGCLRSNIRRVLGDVRRGLGEGRLRRRILASSGPGRAMRRTGRQAKGIGDGLAACGERIPRLRGRGLLERDLAAQDLSFEGRAPIARRRLEARANTRPQRRAAVGQSTRHSPEVAAHCSAS